MTMTWRQMIVATTILCLILPTRLQATEDNATASTGKFINDMRSNSVESENNNASLANSFSSVPLIAPVIEVDISISTTSPSPSNTTQQQTRSETIQYQPVTKLAQATPSSLVTEKLKKPSANNANIANSSTESEVNGKFVLIKPTSGTRAPSSKTTSNVGRSAVVPKLTSHAVAIPDETVDETTTNKSTVAHKGVLYQDAFLDLQICAILQSYESPCNNPCKPCISTPCVPCGCVPPPPPEPKTTVCQRLFGCPRTCKDLYDQGERRKGYYTLTPDGATTSFTIYCTMEYDITTTTSTSTTTIGSTTTTTTTTTAKPKTTSVPQIPQQLSQQFVAQKEPSAGQGNADFYKTTKRRKTKKTSKVNRKQYITYNETHYLVDPTTNKTTLIA